MVKLRAAAQRTTRACGHIAGGSGLFVRNPNQMLRRWQSIHAVFLFIFLLLKSSAAAQVQTARRVLIFYEAGAYHPLPNLVDEGIRSALDHSLYRIEFHREFMETASFPEPGDQQRFQDFYIRKYQNRRPDVIIAVGPAPLRFMVETHSSSFPGVPVVFCLPNRLPGGLRVDPEFTGVEADVAPAATLEAALRLRPGTKHVVVVSGISPFDRQQEAAVRDQLGAYEKRLDISYLSDLAMPDLLRRLKRLPANTIILLGGIGRDARGAVFSTTESGSMIVAAANAPVFSLNDRNLNHGEVGGDVANAVEQGKIVGAMALRILNGEKPQDIPRLKTANTYMFDWQALQRWGMAENNLPPGSILLNRQPGIWETNKQYVLGSISLVIAESLLIVGLILQRTKRRKAEAASAQTCLRLGLAMEAARAVGWEWDVSNGRYQVFGDVESMLGITTDVATVKGYDFRRHIYPEDRALVFNALNQARRSHQPSVAEFRVIDSGGCVRWITARGSFSYVENGTIERMLGISVDITERKMAEAALEHLSGRLIAAQDEERRRIARDIHDDYNQRLALLAIDLEELSETASSDTASRLRECCADAGKIGADLHSLSHSLHSSTLERLGLEAGAKAFCEEFAFQHGLEIDFHADLKSQVVPRDGALCFFRILQEALRNVKKHSGVSRALVRLELSNNRAHLSVSDLGNGFDLKAGSKSGGIGIRSMEERLRLVGGKLEINSRPMEGTRIDAWLELGVRAQFAATSEKSIWTDDVNKECNGVYPLAS